MLTCSREFLVAAMGVAGRQGEFTRAGVQMLAELSPEYEVDIDGGFGRLADQLGLLIYASDRRSGFDSLLTALLGLLGAATVGSAIDDEVGDVGRHIGEAAISVWGDEWVQRLFDAAFHAGGAVSPPLTRYTAPLVYLACNRFMREAQHAGVSITYARSPAAMLPQSYYGGPLLAELLNGRLYAPYDWSFDRRSLPSGSGLRESAVSPFRIFNFEYGVFDDSIRGIRRYCVSATRAGAELQAFVDELPKAARTRYIDLAIMTLARTLEKPYVEMSVVEPPAEFDWWKDHIIRTSPFETMVGLRDKRARSVAHALAVRASVLPQVVDAAPTDELREHLRIYVKNLEFGLLDERYRDDLARETVRMLKPGSIELTPDAATSLAETEIRAMLD